MRVVWYSNSPFAMTGYGRQTSMIGQRLLADGHAVAIANNYGLHGTIMEWKAGAPILPQGADLYSTDILPAHYHAWIRDEPGVLITLYDVWPMKADNVTAIPNIVSWVPVDHAPAPIETLSWFATTGAMPLAMSEFGRDQLVAAGLKDVRYIPHALDLGVFRPRDTLADGSRFRERMKIPDDGYLVVINAANKGRWPPRKGWAEMLGMLGVFMRSRPDTYVYIHTERAGINNGLDLDLLAKARAVPADRIRWADRYALAIGSISDIDMAAITSAADVMLMTSFGEGFGIPAAESMATGTPVIVSNFSAQPEIVGDTGWLVEGQPWWDAEHGADFWMPFIDSGVAALEDAYEHRGDQGRRERARARIAERYDIDKVWPSAWRPLMLELEARAKTAPPPSEKNTAIRPKKKKR